jgi:hypothetical protein
MKFAKIMKNFESFLMVATLLAMAGIHFFIAVILPALFVVWLFRHCGIQ